MKTWRWTLLFVSAGALAFACSVEDNSTDDDGATTETTTTTGSGGSTTSNTVSSTVSTVASTTGGPTCAQQPDFASCAQCFCMQDQAGCGAYIDVIDTFLFCGATCGPNAPQAPCQEYCADPMNVDPTGTPCETCLDTIDCAAAPSGSTQEEDCQGAIQACQSDAACNGFLTDLSMCPQG